MHFVQRLAAWVFGELWGNDMRVFRDCGAASIFNDRHHEHESKKQFAAVPTAAATLLTATCWDRTKAKKNFPHTREKQCFTHLRIPRCWCIRTDPRRTPSVLDDGGMRVEDEVGGIPMAPVATKILKPLSVPSHGFLIKLASRHTSRIQSQTTMGRDGPSSKSSLDGLSLQLSSSS
ncbi:hypothetical protein BDP81DRAFT_34530 [Colletotrichum phormii]|uniref:Uncharacterized protein n=1 Tax=Colletotrichum phormii TaxID=359342 RepID=A0AAI9ZQE4_9PEZI|nr:uncharacterized protein BDP81DRAFT_34530 [Colletotrichum phormii]KAK1636178.1 hypothetical protein BDP81DRAFT_34530 [Colletotrichum phormii]